MTPTLRRELYKLRELIHFLLRGAGGSKRRASNGELLCYFCIQPLADYAKDFIEHGNSIGPKFTEKISIHHIDGNHDNNEEKNKGVCHTSCHKSYHRTLANAKKYAPVVEE